MVIANTSRGGGNEVRTTANRSCAARPHSCLGAARTSANRLASKLHSRSSVLIADDSRAGDIGQHQVAGIEVEILIDPMESVEVEEDEREAVGGDISAIS